MKKFACVSIFIGLTLASCNKVEKVECTDNFVSITTSVKDEDGQPVYGATVYTIRQTGGDTLKLGVQQPTNGTYIVLTDNQKGLVDTQGENYKFLVRKGNKFVSGVYRVKSDLCHIIYVSGPNNLVLR